MFDFKDKIVLITGASRGIGAAVARLFARYDGSVVVNYYGSEDKAKAVLADITNHGGIGSIYKADVSKPDECQAMIDYVINKYGQIDIVVNNAGIWKEAAIDQMSPTQLAETINCNLNGCFYCTTAAVFEMKKRKTGKIIFVSSTAGQRGEAFHSHYAATKGALISLTKSLASELAPFKINVNCVAPGWVDTDMSHEALVSADGPRYLSLIPMARAATAEEIAWPILFLASDMASYITGEILNVNGGSVLVG